MSDTIEKTEKRGRIQIIDALRGLALVLMVFHHAFYDAVAFLGAPVWLFTNPVFDFLHNIFAGVFIALAGVSSRFSRSNWRRAGLCALAAFAVTFVTAQVGETVRFGVLHLLAACMLLYSACEDIWLKKHSDDKPRYIFGLIWVLLTAGSAIALKYAKFTFPFAAILGLPESGFASADYFPLLPWVFVFAFGAWAGKFIAQNRFPAKFYTISVPVLPAIGRKSLLIYLFHQPVLYALTLLILKLRS